MPLGLAKEKRPQKINTALSADFVLLFNDSLLNNQIRSSLNEWDALNHQLDISTQMVEDSRGLLNGKERKFNAKESSLFLVNSQGVQLINSRIKYVELLAKSEQKEINILFSQAIYLPSTRLPETRLIRPASPFKR